MRLRFEKCHSSLDDVTVNVVSSAACPSTASFFLFGGAWSTILHKLRLGIYVNWVGGVIKRAIVGLHGYTNAL